MKIVLKNSNILSKELIKPKNYSFYNRGGERETFPSLFLNIYLEKFKLEIFFLLFFQSLKNSSFYAFFGLVTRINNN